MKRIRITLIGPGEVSTSIWADMEEKDGQIILHLLHDYAHLKVQPGQPISARGLQLQAISVSGRKVTCARINPVSPPEPTTPEEVI